MPRPVFDLETGFVVPFVERKERADKNVVQVSFNTAILELGPRVFLAIEFQEKHGPLPMEWYRKDAALWPHR